MIDVRCRDDPEIMRLAAGKLAYIISREGIGDGGFRLQPEYLYQLYDETELAATLTAYCEAKYAEAATHSR